jgi:beta-glucuronidase
MSLKQHVLFILFLALSFAGYAQPGTQSLSGGWSFALDPLKIGVTEGWTAANFPDQKLDKVTVPHSFSVDKRYFFYTGTAWYFKKFDAKPLKAGTRAFIRFDAVFYKCTIWLNGKEAGTHEGGYTPFELDVTTSLKDKNVLSVMVDNSWDKTTIPGARAVDSNYNAAAAQVYPWINYGGITRPVALKIRPSVYLSNIKIHADPDLKKGNANIGIKVFVKNTSASDTTVTLNLDVQDGRENLGGLFKPVKVSIAGNTSKEIMLQANMPAKKVKLWNHDNPHLYTLQAYTGRDTIANNFGIRKIEVKGAKLLLNGEPIRMGGGNRPADYPGYGSLDPDSILKKDLILMKSAGMELSRIAHHAVSSDLLDWADKHGMLIITEAGNWQLASSQMADPMMRGKFQSQMKEMVERDWNHPSVIAYSLGNEFYSHKPEGQAWVRDMSKYTKELDDTRLITFASYIVFRDYIKRPEDEASQYVDFVSANVYANHSKWIAHIHELYPSKPIYISEFGIMMTPNKTEKDRIAYLKTAIEAFRKTDYVVGASIWSFNDYLSRFPLSNADGYRSWGVVTPDREPRGAYAFLQEEFAPAIITVTSHKDGKLVLNVKARTDFPSYTLQGYQIKAGNKLIQLKTLKPGASQELSLDIASVEGSGYVELIKPGGFVIMKQAFK